MKPEQEIIPFPRGRNSFRGAVGRRGCAIWLARLLVLTWLLLPCGPAAALALQEQVHEFVLDNGLRLLVVPQPTAMTFTAYLTLGVGSVDERDSNRGIAHFLEHMRFKGTHQIGTRDFAAEEPLLRQLDDVVTRLQRCEQEANCPPQRLEALRQQVKQLERQHRQLVVKDEFSEIYARHGGVDFNAFTSKDLTTYLISLPANRLELWFALEADRMKNTVLREFHTEKEVIQEERRRSYESRPFGLLYETLLATAFQVHPYRHPVIGWSSDIAALRKDQLQAFMERYYQPANCCIALVGAVEPAEAHRLAQHYFGGIPAGERVPPVTAVEPPQRGERRVQVRFQAEPQLLVAYHKPTVPSRDDYAFDLLAVLLTDGPTSLLHRRLVLEQQLVTQVSAFGAPGGRYDNLFVLHLVPRHPHPVAEVEAALYAELEQLCAVPPTQQQLDRARKRLRADHLRQLQSHRGLAGMLTHFQVVTGDWRYLDRYDAVIRSLTAAEVQQAAARWLKADNRTVVELVSQEAS